MTSRTGLINLEHARDLPQNIRFGSSTWTYPGWKGLIYKDEYKNEKDFKARSLGEYARCPLFRSVGIDSSFYAPLGSSVLRNYAALVPQGFKWVSKVWERITIPRYPAHPRYGANAGKDNPDFLNADLFCERVLSPCREESVAANCGPFVFQFPPIHKSVLDEIDIFGGLDRFLAKLPSDFSYAVELRNPDLLGPDYLAILNRHKVTHCFNHWHYMPSLREQMTRAADAGGLEAPFYVARILTPRGVSYEAAVKLFSPYDSVKRPNPDMRQDVLRLIKRANERHVNAYIIVNNRAEGNSPMTIDAIIGMLVAGTTTSG